MVETTQNVPSHKADHVLHDARFQGPFDATEFASKALSDRKTSPQEEIDRLQASIDALDQQIKSLALDNKDLLLEQTNAFKSSSHEFQKLFLSVRSLQTVAARVRAEVSEPYGKLCLKTVQLSNMYRTIDLLRQTTTQIKLVQRIRTEMDSDTLDLLDLSKLARLLSEARTLREEVDFSGIRVCEQNNQFVEESKQIIHQKLVSLLQSGVDARSQVDIGGALQALFNLRELKPCLEEQIERMAQRVKKSFMNALDAKKLSSKGVPAFGQMSAQAGQKVLWEQVGKAMEDFKESILSAWYLQKVLLIKKDPLSHQRFIDLVQEEGREVVSMPFDTFWNKCIQGIRDVIDATMGLRSGVVKDALLSGYPRLAGMFESTLGVVLKETNEGRRTTLSEDKVEKYYDALSTVESEYLLNVQARLDNIAATAFPGAGSRALPSQVDLQSLAARFHEEIKQGQHGGERLMNMTTAVIGTVLLTISSQAREMGADSGLLTASGPCNAGQSRNLALGKSLEDIFKTIVIIQGRLPPKAAKALEGPADVVRQCTQELLQPIFKSRADQFESVIKKVHSLNFGAEDGSESNVAEASSYIQELDSNLHSFRQEFLSKCLLTLGSTGIPSVTELMIHSLCGRLISCWIDQICLVRPITNPGRLQIAKDAAEFESALEHHLISISKTGKGVLSGPILSLKAFRRLLFVDDITTLESQQASIIQALPKVAILHHLFSLCPPAIESPYAKNKLTPLQYSTWVEDHSQQEVLQFIESTLRAGSAKLDSQPPVVQVMLNILSSL